MISMDTFSSSLMVFFVGLCFIQWKLLLRAGVFGIHFWEVSFYVTILLFLWYGQYNIIWLEQSRINFLKFNKKHDGGCIEQSSWSSHGLSFLSKSLQDSPFLIYGAVVRTIMLSFFGFCLLIYVQYYMALYSLIGFKVISYHFNKTRKCLSSPSSFL